MQNLIAFAIIVMIVAYCIFTYLHNCDIENSIIDEPHSVNSHNVVFIGGKIYPGDKIYRLYKCVNCYTYNSMEDFEKKVCVPRPDREAGLTPGHRRGRIEVKTKWGKSPLTPIKMGV